jgi:hypothetical protein
MNTMPTLQLQLQNAKDPFTSLPPVIMEKQDSITWRPAHPPRKLDLTEEDIMRYVARIYRTIIRERLQMLHEHERAHEIWETTCEKALVQSIIELIYDDPKRHYLLTFHEQ